jgi:hypothetical protein
MHQLSLGPAVIAFTWGADPLRIDPKSWEATAQHVPHARELA